MSQPDIFKSKRHEERKAYRRRVLTDSEKKRLVSAFADGVSLADLQRRFGMDRNSLRDALRGMGR